MIVTLSTTAAASHEAIVTGLLVDFARQMGVAAARPWRVTDRVIDMPDPAKDDHLAELAAANAALQAAHAALVTEHNNLQAQLAKLAAIQKDLG